MIQIHKIIGNIDSDWNLKNQYEDMLKSGHVEIIEISRLESDRTRMRKSTDKGTDLAISLDKGSRINHGDVVLLTEDKMVIAMRVSENVATISLRDNVTTDQIFKTAIKLGHTIGNMHRPIKITNDKISFPIQGKSEIELFRRLLSTLKDSIDIKNENLIFVPDDGYDIHEH
jgi:urease accessory protein